MGKDAISIEEAIIALGSCKLLALSLVENYSKKIEWNEENKEFLFAHQAALESDYATDLQILEQLKLSILEISVLRRHLKYYKKNFQKPYKRKHK